MLSNETQVLAEEDWCMPKYGRAHILGYLTKTHAY